MKKLKIPKTILYVLGILLILYLIACLIFSFMFNNLLNEIYLSKSYESISSPIFISKETYDRMNIKSDINEDYIGKVHDKYDHSFPIALIGINKIRVFYKYDYEAFDDNNELVYGCADIDPSVTISFIEGKLTLTKYQEPI